jgi:hypothetical protein
MDLYDRAAIAWRDYGNVLEHGNAQLGLGRCAAQLADPRADAALRAAHAAFTRLGSRPLVDDVDSLLDGEQRFVTGHTAVTDNG